MNPGTTIQDAIGQILADAPAKRDYLVPTTTLRLNGDDRTIEWGADASNQHTLTRHAHGQIADYLGIPRRFYDRLQTEAPGLISVNVNRLMAEQKPERRMIRTLRGDARAFLSDRYRPLDHEEVAERILPMIEDHGFEIRSVKVTDSRFYLHAISPRLEGEVRVGDPVRFGWLISNSEIGMGSLEFAPMIERLRCTNGMVIAEYSQKKAHLGMRLTAGGDDYLIQVGEDTRRAADDALWFGIRDHVKALTTEDGLRRVLGTLRDRADEPVTGDPELVVEEVGKRFAMVEPERKSALYSYLQEGDFTRWGLTQAITQIANTHDNYDRAVELERHGGALMAMGGREFKALAGITA